MILIWSLFILQPFYPFSLLHITAVTFSKDKPCKSLVSVGNGFLSTDSVYRSLLKMSWQENLMIPSTGWLKNSRCTIEPEQSCSCVKKSKQRRWSGHDCTSRVVVGWVDYPTCVVLGHSMNSSCSVRGVDCEHHKEGEVVNQQIFSTD